MGFSVSFHGSNLEPLMSGGVDVPFAYIQPSCGRAAGS
jgi:hypothetical protein